MEIGNQKNYYVRPQGLEKLTNVFPICNQAFKIKKYLKREIQRQGGRLGSKEAALDLTHACVSLNIKANFAEQKFQFC